MSRLVILIPAVLFAAACTRCSAPARQTDDMTQVGAELETACRSFYAEHGRWPRDLDELRGFDSSRLRSVEFHKRLVEGGLEIRYTARSARRGEGPTSMYLPPPRSWSPKGARTQPTTAPAQSAP